VERPNRFIVEARLADGRAVEAHLADPGRLKELLMPGAELRLRAAPEEGLRRTAYTVALVRASEAPRSWVSVETSRANRLAEELLRRGQVHGLGRGWELCREVRHGASRFDFCLRRTGHAPHWVEVKSVTFAERGVARFPDAPTARGRRHVRELAERARAGDSATVLFVVQRGDVGAVTTYAEIDPDFDVALREARDAGVRLRAARFGFEDGGQPTYLGPLRVKLGRRING
jgi:sugar fermentation stimulation protein A